MGESYEAIDIINIKLERGGDGCSLKNDHRSWGWEGERWNEIGGLVRFLSMNGTRINTYGSR